MITDNTPRESNGEAVVHLNPNTHTYHLDETCGGTTQETVRLGECLFDADTSPCGNCVD